MLSLEQDGLCWIFLQPYGLYKFAGDIECNERIRKLEKERSTLLQEKEQLMKRRDELKAKLEHSTPKDDYKPKDTKVLHVR